jgi:hypothetical protein
MTHETLKILHERFPMFDWVSLDERNGLGTNNGLHGYNSGITLHLQLSQSEVFGYMVKCWIDGIDRWHFGKGQSETDVIVSLVQGFLQDIGYQVL